jgi:NADH:ubiquinone oxidoreductase subunit F (NADH-binding)
VLNSRPVVIGAEGEPRSRKDAALLRNSPHLVIDGLLAAAAAVAASQVYLYTSAGNLPSLRAALAERSDSKRIQLVEAPDTFVSGEASAVVNAIENTSALPVDRVRRLSDSGLKRRPTLVHNVETLAQMALIARFGPAWFRSRGSDRDPGTRLVTVTGDVDREGVAEVAGDTPICDILRSFGAPEDALAVLVGGFHGTSVPGGRLGLRLSTAGLSGLGGQPGAGVLFVLGSNRCGLRETAGILRYLAGESARQCGPCLSGLPALAKLLTRVAASDRDPALAGELRRISESVTGRGSCHHPDGTARLALSALSAFGHDLTQHQAGRCTATP